MTILKRMRNIFQSNINAALDKLEDPVKSLDLIAEDMRKEIAAAKKKVSEAITQEKLIKKELEGTEESIDAWAERAEKALRMEKEDLARDALKEKKKCTEKTKIFKLQWQDFKQESDRLKTELKKMEERYEQVLLKKDTLVAKAKIAEARSAAAYVPSPSITTEESHQAFERAEAKVRHMEAKAAADREIADEILSSTDKTLEIEKLCNDDTIDDEMAKLKSKIKKE